MSYTINSFMIVPNSNIDYSADMKRYILLQSCKNFYKTSLVYICKGENPCIKSLNQYTKCIKLVKELEELEELK